MPDLDRELSGDEVDEERDHVSPSALPPSLTFLRMKNHLFEAYLDFCKSKSYYELTAKIKEWSRTIFGFSKMKVMFHQDEKLCEYSANDVKRFDVSNGVIGRCAILKRPIIIADMRVSKYYNSQVDLQTLLPVMC